MPARVDLGQQRAHHRLGRGGVVGAGRVELGLDVEAHAASRAALATASKSAARVGMRSPSRARCCANCLRVAACRARCGRRRRPAVAPASASGSRAPCAASQAPLRVARVVGVEHGVVRDHHHAVGREADVQLQRVDAEQPARSRRRPACSRAPGRGRRDGPAGRRPGPAARPARAGAAPMRRRA